jgi:uncharacterized membrane protein YkvA (DUF1232 family)
MRRAAQYARDPEKLKDLTRKAQKRAESARGDGVLKDFWDGLMTLVRLVRAYAKGDYRQVPWQTLIFTVAAVLYFLMPIDVIPDFLVGLGYVDDAAVIAWLMNAARSEIEKFRRWETIQSGMPAD